MEQDINSGTKEYSFSFDVITCYNVNNAIHGELNP
jgi:hypothetical protein